MLLVLLLLVSLRPLLCEKVKDLPKPTNYVSDFAGVLSPQTTLDLNRLCYQVDTQAHAQIAVVTIKTLEDESIENFATDLETRWGVGPKKNDRGILIILATDDRKRRIEVGYGLEGVITDVQANDIGTAMVPALKDGDYDSAVTLAVTQIASRIAADAGVTLQAPRRGPPRPVARPMSLGELLILGVVFLLLIFFVARSGGSGILGFIIGMLLGGGGGGGGGNDDQGGGFGGFGGGRSGGGGASGDW